jgi:hypothetical protein
VTTQLYLHIKAPARLLTLNLERNLHYHRRAEIVLAWRWGTKALALAEQVPHFSCCSIRALVHQAHGVLADPGNHLPVVKAAIDGLRDAQVLPDDSGEFIKELCFLPPVRGADALALTLKGELA